MIVAAENGELALQQSKEAPSANGPIGTGGLLLSSEALDLLNKSSEGSLGTHTLASSPPPASHTTHPAPSSGTSLPPPSQPGLEEPKLESHSHSTKTESAGLDEGLGDSSVDGPVLEDSCVDSPNTAGPCSIVVGGGEEGAGADAVHALSAPSGRSVSHSPDDEKYHSTSGEVDVNIPLGREGEEAEASRSENDDRKNSDVEICVNSGPVASREVQGSESMEESVLVGMLTSSHDQDSRVCKDSGQKESDQASESGQMAEQDPSPGDKTSSDFSHIASESSSPGGGSDLPSVVVTECSHSQQGSSQDLEDDFDEFFDAVSTPLPSPIDTSVEFEVTKKSMGESTPFEVSEVSTGETSVDVAGLSTGDTSFDVAGATTGKTCDTARLNTGDTSFDVAGVTTEETFDAAGVNTEETGDVAGSNTEDTSCGVAGVTTEETFDVAGSNTEDTSFDVAGVTTGETFDAAGVNTEKTGDVAGSNTEDTSFDVAGVTTGETCDAAGVNMGETSTDGASPEVGSSAGKDDYSEEVDGRDSEGEGGVGKASDADGLRIKGEEHSEGNNRVECELGAEERETDVEMVVANSTDDKLEGPHEGSEANTEASCPGGKEVDADSEKLIEESIQNQSSSEVADDSGEGVDEEDKDGNFSTAQVDVTPAVEGQCGHDTDGLHTQSSQLVTDISLGDGASATADRDSVDFSDERADEDFADASGVQDGGEVAVIVNSDESSDVVEKNVCERKESVTVSSESGEHGGEGSFAGVDTEDVVDMKVTSEAEEVVGESNDSVTTLNEEAGSDETQTLSAFSAEKDEASPASAPELESDDKKCASESTAEADETSVTLTSATELDEQLVTSASKTDSEAEHPGAEAVGVVGQDGEAKPGASGESCQEASEEKQAEVPPEPEPVLSKTESAQDEVASKEDQEEADSSKQSKGADSSECQGERDVGAREESEELPDTLSPLLDVRKQLKHDLSEGGTSEDSEARLDDEYDFDDIDEVLADGSSDARKEKGGGQNLDNASGEAAVSFGSRDSGLQDSICNKENEASQGDTASFGSVDSGLQESAPNKESEASREDSTSMKSRDSGSVAEDTSSFLSEDSTTDAPEGAEGGAEGCALRVVESRESLDLEAKLDKMGSDDSSAKKAHTKEKHKKSKKFKMFKKIFK